MLTENDIQTITRRIVRGCAPLAMGIFGSYATGLVRPSSDLDVFVIQRQAGGKSPPRILAVRRHLWGVLHPLDISVFTALEFEEAAYQEHSFVSTIVAQARIYHWTGEAGRLLPSLLPKGNAWNASRVGSSVRGCSNSRLPLPTADIQPDPCLCRSGHGV